jgi:GT2 family glycosyltransferase
LSAPPPLVSIITINFNQSKVTEEFLHSLSKLNYRNFEVIVIDNASVEDTISQLKLKFPNVRLYRTIKNLGFTGGNNLGMKLAKGEYVFLVNNDTEIVDANLLEKLIEPFQLDSSVGMVSPKIRYFHSPEVIQFAGYNKINSFTGRNSQVGDGEIDKGQYNTPGYTHYANGAAMMVKREVLEKVGLLTDHFFLCYEELDWAAQTVKYGYRVYYQGQVYLFHKESVSMGKTSPLKVYYNNRNRIMFMRRNTNAFEFSCFLIYLSLLTIPKNILTFLFKGQFKHLMAFVKAIDWNIRNINIYKHIPFHTKLDQISLDSVQKSL